MAVEERWVSVDEVATHLGVNRDSIYRWVDKKGFPAHRVGRLFRFKLSEVDEWVRDGGAGEDSNTESTGNA
ncbi:MAG: helix-turn-helix domain-containing protein [Rhodopirellula sp.]|nr:helix-turn-helix domain-containing protein [Rhodopirellula sp.]